VFGQVARHLIARAGELTLKELMVDLIDSPNLRQTAERIEAIKAGRGHTQFPTNLLSAPKGVTAEQAKLVVVAIVPDEIIAAPGEGSVDGIWSTRTESGEGTI
jgi:hypothetical protein